jgi:uncharacterized protein YdaU (DUF1376 family)
MTLTKPWKKVAACLLLAFFSLNWCVPAQAKPRTDPRVRAAQKAVRKQQKAARKQMRAQQKAAQRAARQNTRGPHTRPSMP